MIRRSYSLLGSVYHRESPAALAQCLESIALATLGDNAEVVLVQDGPLTPELLAVIDQFRSRMVLVDVPLPENVGLGAALNAGLARCSHDLVARFDTDDIDLPARFALQLQRFACQPDLALLGGWIDEFVDDPAHPHAERHTPVSHDSILQFARKRNPFNHMTVMFRKQAVLAVGGYGGEYLFEDYALWVRLLQAGYATDNLPAVLTHARTGTSMYRRRGGWRYAVSEWRLLRQFCASGFINRYQMLGSALMRLPVRLLPAGLRGWIYCVPLRARATAGKQLAQ